MIIILTFITFQKYSSTLECVLRHYADPIFQQCIQDDVFNVAIYNTSDKGTASFSWGAHQGVNCLKQVFFYDSISLKLFIYIYKGLF